MKKMFALAVAIGWLSVRGEPVSVILDTDMLTDFDDVGALACLHALADSGEAEILAVVSSTRGNASVGAIQVINSYYGRPGIPVGCVKGAGVMGAYPGAMQKVGPSEPLGEKTKGDGGHYKYRKLVQDYPDLCTIVDSDDAPDANLIYRKALAGAGDGSVTICSVGFLTNLRRLLETGGDDLSPLDGRSLVSRKVRRLVVMAGRYPRGKEYNVQWDVESARLVFSFWPTQIVFSDFEYGMDVFAGRAIVEKTNGRNPVRDVFAENIPSRREISSDAATWQRRCFGMNGRSSWDETAVLAAVRGVDMYFNAHRGAYRIVGSDGEDEWVPDEEMGPHVRLGEKVNKVEVGKIIDELICQQPKLKQTVYVGFGKGANCGR